MPKKLTEEDLGFVTETMNLPQTYKMLNVSRPNYTAGHCEHHECAWLMEQLQDTAISVETSPKILIRDCINRLRVPDYEAKDWRILGSRRVKLLNGQMIGNTNQLYSKGSKSKAPFGSIFRPKKSPTQRNCLQFTHPHTQLSRSLSPLVNI